MDGRLSGFEMVRKNRGGIALGGNEERKLNGGGSVEPEHICLKQTGGVQINLAMSSRPRKVKRKSSGVKRGV